MPDRSPVKMVGTKSRDSELASGDPPELQAYEHIAHTSEVAYGTLYLWQHNSTRD